LELMQPADAALVHSAQDTKSTSMFGASSGDEGVDFSGAALGDGVQSRRPGPR
jgi:hypothetical protein